MKNSLKPIKIDVRMNLNNRDKRRFQVRDKILYRTKGEKQWN